MRRLSTLFPSGLLEEHAEFLGVVERIGKFQILMWYSCSALPHANAEYLPAPEIVTTSQSMNDLF